MPKTSDVVANASSAKSTPRLGKRKRAAKSRLASKKFTTAVTTTPNSSRQDKKQNYASLGKAEDEGSYYTHFIEPIRCDIRFNNIDSQKTAFWYVYIK